MLTDAKVRSAKPRPKSYKLVDANRLFLLVTPAAASSGCGAGAGAGTITMTASRRA